MTFAAAISKIPYIGGVLAQFSKGAVITAVVAFFVPVAAAFQSWLVGGNNANDPVVVPIIGIKQSTVILGVLTIAVAGLAAAAVRRK